MRAALGRMHEFLMALEKAGFTEEIIVETINSKGNKLAGEMFNALPEALRTKWKTSDLILIFRVDSEIVQKKFLKAIGDNHNEEIFTEGKRISIKNEVSGDVHSKVFHFNYVISNDDCIKEMRKKGCRPATDYETLTFCQSNQAWAKHYKVCALGTTYSLRDTYYSRFYYADRSGVSCLTVENHYYENDNLPSDRFLGVFDSENKVK
jgi:hypothetical protein